MENGNLLPKNINPDNELKSQIVFESLCENYTIEVIEGILNFLKIEKIELADDNISRRILNILNGKI